MRRSPLLRGLLSIRAYTPGDVSRQPVDDVREFWEERTTIHPYADVSDPLRVDNIRYLVSYWLHGDGGRNHQDENGYGCGHGFERYPNNDAITVNIGNGSGDIFDGFGGTIAYGSCGIIPGVARRRLWASGSRLLVSLRRAFHLGR